MKNKVVAAFLALLFGVFGAHRFYLNETSKGFFRMGLFVFALMAEFPFLVTFLALWAFVEAIVLFSMSQKEFDKNYNGEGANVQKRGSKKSYNRTETRQARQYRREARGDRRTATLHNPHKKRGVEYYKDYDYVAAIEEFEKALEVQDNDIATHFNISCAYSLTEQKENALYHLDKAVALGFSDFDKIRNKDAFAYLRVQPEYEEFEANGFRIDPQAEDDELQTPTLEAPKRGLLDDELVLKKLERLGELRDRGIITTDEFIEEKHRILRND